MLALPDPLTQAEGALQVLMRAVRKSWPVRRWAPRRCAGLLEDVRLSAVASSPARGSDQTRRADRPDERDEGEGEGDLEDEQNDEVGRLPFGLEQKAAEQHEEADRE